MTMKTQIMLAIAAITIMTTVGLSEAYASNWNGNTWDHDDVTYKCISVSGITKTSNVDPCGDIATTTNVWEVSDSDLTITGVTSGSYDIPVYAWTSGVSGAGKTVLYITGTTIDSGYVAMNKNLSWEDSNVDTSSDGYDWMTATGHEFGHVSGLSHYTANAYIMFSPLGENDADRNPTSHSTNHIKDNY